MSASVMGMSAVRYAVAVLGLAVALTGCERTLVYGERSGFNVSITADPAKSLPLEVNAGLKRRVVGLIPSSEERQGGQVTGEAVNMFSRFDLSYDESSDGVLFGTHRVSTAFASGAAAVTISRQQNAERIVAAIVDPLQTRVPDDPAVRKAITALLNFTGASSVQRNRYLTLAEERGLKILPERVTPNQRAVLAIGDPANAAQNQEIARELNLLE